jgi:hypothetical protein
MKPELFIGSSVEGLEIAEAIERNLQFKFNVTIWTNGVFDIGSTTIDDLIKRLDKSDFGIFIFTPDDVTKIRGTQYTTARDNVLYELGLYTGKLGRYNTFIIKPSELAPDFHLPTDLTGIYIGNYNSQRLSEMDSAVSPFCSQIKKQILNNSKYVLNGKWKFSWEVKNSTTYPDTIYDEVELFHYEEDLKFIHTISDTEKYIFSGKFRNPYFTGFWKDIKDIGYDGVFQMKLNGRRQKFEGIWSGWNNNGDISSGPCFFEKL